MLDLDLIDLISAHLRVMKLCVAALQPAFRYTIGQLKCCAVLSIIIHNIDGIFYLTKLYTFVAVHFFTLLVIS